MAATAKANIGPKASAEGRTREVAGIFLLAFGLFAGASLISTQVGHARLMGPGGAATAAGLYSLAGFGAYLLVGLATVVAIRCFRGRSLLAGVGEGVAILGVLVGACALLHLPFSGRAFVARGAAGGAARGPGGLVGQWTGEMTASFIGVPGAALAGVAVLAAALLVLTNTRMAEVLVVLGWAARHAGRGLLAGACVLGRAVVALFPERSARPAEGQMDADVEAEAADVDDDEPVIHEGGDAEAAPARPMVEASEAVRVGEEPDETPEALVAAAPVDMETPPDAPEAVAPADSEDLPAAVPAPARDPERVAMAAVLAEIVAAEPVVVEADLPAAPAVEAAPVASLAADTVPNAEPILIAGVASSDFGAPTVAAVEPGPVIVESEYSQPKDAPPAKSGGPGFIKFGDGDFKLPPRDLLVYEPPTTPQADRGVLLEKAQRLEQSLVNFKIKGKVREIHPGPVVTLYEFVPAPGTKVASIMNLENDLAISLEVPAVRVTLIPNKGAVGVEVPNKDRQTVYLKEILDDECMTAAASKLQVALGKDIKGAPVSVNLAKMPHLLVAGTTGSGKSVTVNGMIASILCNATPEEVRFIMVDPKMLEFSIYEGIPHLLLPVVTDPKKANLALRWAVDEMERRYELLAKSGVRDISGYNAKVGGDATPKAAMVETPSAKQRRLKVVITAADGTEQEVEVDSNDAAAPGLQAQAEASAPVSTEPQARKLPYIVIVIDEFADLMMVAAKDVETSVARIAQKARAAGIHLILATQRPSVDVITGLIKANFPSRIGLQVASRIDSRTILDAPGADTLLGNGDMLFSDRGTKLKRVHGAFLSDPEVHRVVDFLKKQAKPVYDMDILKPREEEAEEGAAPVDDTRDEHFDKAVAIVCETRNASVSYLQRRLTIGFNRAARIVEQMEREGIVGPANGSKPREVIAPAGAYLTQPTA